MSYSDNNLTRKFWQNAIPAIVSMLVSGIYVLTDGIFIGQFVGSEGLAAINQAFPVFTLLSGLGLMIGMGAGTVISIYRGERKTERATQALVTSLLLLLLVSLGAMAFLLVASDSLLLLQQANGENFRLASEYLNVLAYGALMPIAATALPLLIRNDDSPNTATLLMVAGALLNIALNYLYMGILDWSIAGAALATICAQLVLVLGAVAYFYSGRASIGLKRAKLCFNRQMAWRSIALGFSLFIMHSYMGFVVAIHNGLFMHYGSALHVSGYAIIGYLVSLYYMFAQGVSEGMQPLVSYFHGAKQGRAIRKVTMLASKVVLLSGVISITVLNLWPEFFISWFNDEASLLAVTTRGIQLHIFGMFLDGFIALATIYYMAVNNANKALLISLGNMLIQLPFLYALPQWWGETGIWLAMPLSNVLLAAIVAPMLLRDLPKASLNNDSNSPQPEAL